MTRTILVTFGGLSESHPQTKLSGFDLDVACCLENSIGIWYLGLMNALKYRQCENSYFYLKLF